MDLRKLGKLFLVVYVFTTIFSMGKIAKTYENTWALSEGLSGNTLGIVSVSAVFPSVSIENQVQKSGKQAQLEILDSASRGKKTNKDSKVAEEKDKATSAAWPKNDKDPQVLIVHTHATESYLPASAGNYHTTKNKNTVRDVGDVMMKYLQKESVKVYHNKTIHDNPSYNESYSKCYETVERLLEKYPTITCVIDLHRDAIPSSVEASTHKVRGNSCADYSYVIGSLATTVKSNKSFIKRLNRRAAESLNGFTGEIMSRGYTYNQSLCKKYLLLEIGNNRNTIGQARNTARYLAEIIAREL